VVNSSAEMAETIGMLLQDRDRRRRLGETGRMRIAEKHSWDVITDQYERLYYQVTSKPRMTVVA
jgi:glycosyltransferase involved in cell wall biosynthesis